MLRITLLAGAVVLAGVTAATAQDISVGSCAGVRDVVVSPSHVGVGGAWVNPRSCVGPR